MNSEVSLFPKSPFVQEGVFVDSLWKQVLASGGGEAINSKHSHAGLGEAKWVHIDNNGKATRISIDRNYLVHTLKLRYRDLAAIDPTLILPSPSVILVRARAIALNLDVGGAIRVIICENQVFVLSLPKDIDPSLTAIPTEQHPVVRRLCCYLNPNEAEPCPDGSVPPPHHHSSTPLKSTSQGTTATIATAVPGAASENNNEAAAAAVARDGSGSSHSGSSAAPIHDFSSPLDVDTDMPYELRALEVVLATAVGVLTQEISALEEWAYPAADALVKHMDIENLEAIRRVKNTIDRLQTKVKRLVTELQELLGDDDDMADLYLGRRAAAYGLPPLRQPWEPADPLDEAFSEELEAFHRHAAAGLGPSRFSQLREEEERRRGQLGRRRHRRNQSQSSPRLPAGEGVERRENDEELSRHARSRSFASGRARSARNLQQLEQLAELQGEEQILDAEAFSTSDSAEASDVLENEEEDMMARQGSVEYLKGGDRPLLNGTRIDPHMIEQAEDMLESAYERADLLLRRLELLDEQIDDVEDLLDLDLDNKRNQLFGLNLIVSAMSMAFGFAAALSGVFGMNLVNAQLENEGWVLGIVMGVMIVVSIGLFSAVVLYVKKKKLFFIPTTL